MNEQEAGSNIEDRERARTWRPRVWVASLSDYNSGVLHGDWLDAATTPDELGRAIAGVLASSPTPRAEEWAIFDSDDFGGLRIDEHEALAVVTALATGIAAHGGPFIGWAELCDRDPAQLGRFPETYLGQYPSLEAYATELLDDLGYTAALDRLVPAWLRPYAVLDGAAFARDLHLGGALLVCSAPDGGVWVYEGG